MTVAPTSAEEQEHRPCSVIPEPDSDKHPHAATNGSSRGSQQPLLQPYKLGPFELSTRMVYAPLTRCRALGTIPQPAAAEYYAQRAFSGSFLLSEGTVVSPHGHGYPNTPSINAQEHVEAWKPIVKAVHDKGGVFFMQLWHVGRVSHADYQPDDQGPVAASPIAISGEQDTANGKAPYPVPRELRTEELPQIVEQFVQGARNALAAGFDGVEIHGAHGYLLEGFLKESSNKRSDAYGGSIENRCRLPLEVVDAVLKVVGPGKVGIRLSPFTKFMDSSEPHPYDVYGHLVSELNKRDLEYVHFVEPRINEYMGGGLAKDEDSLAPFRKAWKGNTFIAAGGYEQENGNKALADGHADLICYGRHWIANPDMPERFRLNAPLNKYDRSTFYSSDQKVGYTDYPFLEEGLAKELAAKANL